MKKFLVSITGAVLLSACASSAVATDRDPRVSTISGKDQKPSGGFWHGRVNGVECIWAEGYASKSGGISCNWQPK